MYSSMEFSSLIELVGPVIDEIGKFWEVKDQMPRPMPTSDPCKIVQ